LRPLPRRYRSFIAAGEVEDDPAGDPGPEDRLVVLDSGAAERAAPFVTAWCGRAPLLNMDHHVSNSHFGSVNWIDAQASSAGEMVCALAAAAGWSMPPAAAEALWVAIVTDTGRFSYENTSPSALQTAAGLLAGGFSPFDVDGRVYRSFRLAELRLHQRAIESLQLHEQGRVAVVGITSDDFFDTGCGPEDAEDVVNIPRSLEGAQVAAFLYEMEQEARPGRPGGLVTKVSLRAAAPHDAAALCATLGGGGHQRAAGCTLAMRLPEARAHLLQRIHAMWFPGG
jgi:phosphoesterase RecJ-like protein